MYFASSDYSIRVFGSFVRVSYVEILIVFTKKGAYTHKVV